MAVPFLTIVVPVYQVEDYLRRCVDSILAQEYQDYELLLINDGSLDSSPQICDDYAQRYAHIRVVHKSNGGLSDARNTGIRQAQGKYIAFIDSDDWLAPNCLQSVMPVLEQGQYDLLCFGRQFVQSEKETLKQVEQPKMQVVSGYEAYLEMLNQGLVTGFATDKIYRTSLFRENNLEFPVGCYYEDLGVLYLLLLASNQVVLSNQVFYHYFVDNPHAITASWTEKKLQDMLGFYQAVHHSEPVQQVLQISDQKLADAYYTNGLIHILSSIYKAGLEVEYAQIVAEITTEIATTAVSLKEMGNQPNKTKYLLYRLSLLKPAFQLQRFLKEKG